MTGSASETIETFKCYPMRDGQTAEVDGRTPDGVWPSEQPVIR